MRGYSRSRAALKHINLSHSGVDSIEIKQSVTARLLYQEDKAVHSVMAVKNPLQLKAIKPSKAPTHTERPELSSNYSPEIT